MCTLGFLNLTGIGPCRLINQIQDTMNQIVLNLPFCKQHCHYYWSLALQCVFKEKKKWFFSQHYCIFEHSSQETSVLVKFNRDID